MLHSMLEFEEDVSSRSRKRRRDGKGVVNRLQLIIEMIENTRHKYKEEEVDLFSSRTPSTPKFTAGDLDIARKVCKKRHPTRSFAEPTGEELEELEKTLVIQSRRTHRYPTRNNPIRKEFDLGCGKENYEENSIEPTDAELKELELIRSQGCRKSKKQKKLDFECPKANDQNPFSQLKIAQIYPNSIMDKTIVMRPVSSLTSTFEFSKYDPKAFAKALPNLKVKLAPVFQSSIQNSECTTTSE